jgi:hypothetical protein
VNGLRTKRVLRTNSTVPLSLQAFGGSGVGLRTKRIIRNNSRWRGRFSLPRSPPLMVVK